MEEKLPGRPIKIIKSVENKNSGVFSEEVYKVCANDKEALRTLKEIEEALVADVNYELMHPLKDYSSVSFMNVHTQEQIRFFTRSEEHTSELQSRENLVCRLLLEKKK